MGNLATPRLTPAKGNNLQGSANFPVSQSRLAGLFVFRLLILGPLRTKGASASRKARTLFVSAGRQIVIGQAGEPVAMRGWVSPLHQPQSPSGEWL